MSLSDCARCGDTPCQCGNDGYVVVYPPADLVPRLRALTPAEYEAVVGDLKNRLIELLKKPEGEP